MRGQFQLRILQHIDLLAVSFKLLCIEPVWRDCRSQNHIDAVSQGHLKNMKRNVERLREEHVRGVKLYGGVSIATCPIEKS